MNENKLNRKPSNFDYIDDSELDDFTKQNVRSVVENAFDYQEDDDVDDEELKNSQNPGSKTFYRTGVPVYAYKDLLKSSRQNVKVDGFWFDVDTFENIIDCFTPEKMVPVILRCTGADLDRFCQIVYGMKYSETYTILSGITDMYMRKSFKAHSNLGNPTAMKVVAEHFMNLKNEDQSGGVNIVFCNDLKGDEGE